MSSVFLPDEDKVINISVEHLEPVEPEKGNRVSNSLEKVSVQSDLHCTLLHALSPLQVVEARLRCYFSCALLGM